MERLFEPDLTKLLPPPRGPLFLLAGLLVTLVLVLGAFAITSEYHRTLDVRGKLARSYERRIIVADLLSHVQAAETARRGGGGGAAARQYRSATHAILYQRRALEMRLIAVPRQEARYAELASAIDVVTQPAGAGGAAARRRAMNRVRGIGAAMMVDEDRMIAVRIATDKDRMATVQSELDVLATVLAVLAGVALILEWRGRKTRHRLATDTHAAVVRLRGVFEATSDAMALIDPSGRIEVVNPAVGHLLGHAPGALIGRDITVLVDALPAGGKFHERLDLEDGALREPLRINRIAHHRDGHDVPVDVSLGLMPVRDGLHVVVAIRDVSERRRVERMQDEFVATVSHELRTPLTSIVGALRLLRANAGTTLPEGGRRLVQVAEENSQRLIAMVNDLLDIEKMGVGELRFHNRPVDLTPVLRQVAAANEALAADAGVHIVLEHASTAIGVRGDEGRLSQVVTNLLANAIRFSPQGGTVTITAASDQGRAVVTVEDRGPGVPPAFRDRLFTRFAQYEEGGTAGGTGLGLAISRQIMRAHGGTIWFEPRAGGGALFGFALPLRLGEDATPHLLICAEHSAAVCGLRRLAEAGACSADRVATVADAQAAIRSGTYDAVLIDLAEPAAIGARFLTAYEDAAVAGRWTVPVIVRDDGMVRIGTGPERSAWPAFEVGAGDLAVRIRALRDGIGRARPLIVHIDGDDAVVEQTADALQRRARLLRGSDLATAYALLDRERPALLILDQDMPDGDVADLLARIALDDGAGLGGGRPIATILYSARPVTPVLERMADSVVTRSQRSSVNLIAAVDRLLARTDAGRVRDPDAAVAPAARVMAQ